MSTAHFDSYNKNVLSIELASSDDAEIICRIRDEAWIDAYPSKKLGLSAKDVRIAAQGRNGEFVPRRIAWFRQKLSEPGKDWVMYVGKIDGVVRGFVVASTDEGRKFVNSLYVQPGFQHEGFGTQLMQKALDWLGTDEDIYLEVASHNDNAIHFYKHFSFVKTDNAVADDPGRPSYIKPIPQTEMVLKVR